MGKEREDIEVIFEMDNSEARIVGTRFEVAICTDMDKSEILHLIDEIIMEQKEKRAAV